MSGSARLTFLKAPPPLSDCCKLLGKRRAAVGAYTQDWSAAHSCGSHMMLSPKSVSSST